MAGNPRAALTSARLDLRQQLRSDRDGPGAPAAPRAATRAASPRSAELQQDEGAHHPGLRKRRIDADRFLELPRRLLAAGRRAEALRPARAAPPGSSAATRPPRRNARLPRRVGRSCPVRPRSRSAPSRSPAPCAASPRTPPRRPRGRRPSSGRCPAGAAGRHRRASRPVPPEKWRQPRRNAGRPWPACRGSRRRARCGADRCRPPSTGPPAPARPLPRRCRCIRAASRLPSARCAMPRL